MPSARQVVERLPRLGEAGAEPALRLLAGELLQQLDGLADGLALVGEQVHRPLDDPVAHELPAGVQHGAGHRLVGLDHVGVDGGGGADLPLGERVQQPPEAHAHPVVVPGPVGHVGHDGHPLGRGQVLARHRLLDVPLLDVDDGPHRDAGPLGQLPGLAGGERASSRSDRGVVSRGLLPRGVYSTIREAPGGSQDAGAGLPVPSGRGSRQAGVHRRL